MQIIPLSAVASQTFAIVLAQQNCTISVFQKSTGMFLDLLVSGAPVIRGVICLDAVRILQQTYQSFVGDLMFMDMQGSDDPKYAGLGTRWVLMYLEASDF